MSSRPILALRCALAIFPAFGFAADGQPDPDFGTAGTTFVTLDGVEGHELRAGAAITLPDGSLLFGGSRNKLIAGNPDPHERATIVRLLPDGTPDAAFGNIGAPPGLRVLPDLVPGDQIQVIESLHALDDGSILAAGSAHAFGPLIGFVAKLDAQGQFVTGFGDQGVALFADTFLHALDVDSEGRIVVTGERSTPGHDAAVVMRLRGDGSLDSEFGAAANGIVTLTATGENGYRRSLAVQPDDRIVVGGSDVVPDPDVGEISWAAITRLDSDGELDTSFASTGSRRFRLPGTTSSYNGVNKLLLLPGERIAFAAFYNGDTGVDIMLGRFDADGSDDISFGSTATPGYRAITVMPDAWSRYVSGFERQGDGRLVFSITYAVPGERQKFMAMRTLPDGAEDVTFGNAGAFALDLAPNGVYSDSTALALQAGRPIIAGASMRSSGSSLVDLGVVRLDNDNLFTTGFED